MAYIKRDVSSLMPDYYMHFTSIHMYIATIFVLRKMRVENLKAVMLGKKTTKTNNYALL